MEIRHSLYGTAVYWDEQAASFDDEPDHGLTNDRVRAAWSRRLTTWLPELPRTVVDLGCGTGSLAVLVAEAGHDVVGVDVSPAMVKKAQHKAKAADLPIRFLLAMLPTRTSLPTHSTWCWSGMSPGYCPTPTRHSAGGLPSSSQTAA